MQKLLPLLLTLLLFSYGQAQKSHHHKALNSRSDTVDILNYQINLDMTNINSRLLSGNCAVQFTPKVNGITRLDLDLEALFVDSVYFNGSPTTYTYNSLLINVSLPISLNTSDTAVVTVFYRGSPRTSPTGWGGFYLNSGYAFNMGVGLNDDPHNYGRIWFPCFDNFVERSTYEFNITTTGSQKAHCNGELISEVVLGNTTTRNWVMNDEIPTYLANFAIADYETVHQSYNGMNKPVPVELVALQADTANMKSSFIHLDSALSTYESHYGPYEWNKIGFVLVPFNAGAMEHATNVSFPRSSANGSLSDETLMAHEFSHSWWGNLVTCETSADMWINEGMATYSEHLFLEEVYDYATALVTIKDNHKAVLQFTHHREGGYRAISGVPQQYTYSEHVYNKGASVAHNMRAYLGDSLFFVGLKSIIANYKFQNINSSQFRDELTASTGINMTDFFNDWVFSPGFSHFNIDSIEVIPNGNNFNTTVFIQQKLKGASSFHNNTPVELSFYDSNLNRFDTTVSTSGQFSATNIRLPFNPEFYILNEANRLNQARTDQQIIVRAPLSNIDYDIALVESFTVNSLSDSALIQMEHHWVSPDSIQNNVNNYQISNHRYWSFNGQLPTTFNSSFRLYFDGRPTNGFLDLDLYASSTDTLILLYRANTKSDWAEYPYYSKTRQGFNFGYVTVDSLLLGEFTFGNKKRVISTGIEKEHNAVDFNVFPNPSDKFVWIEAENNSANNELKIFDMEGNLVYQAEMQQRLKVNTSKWTPGNYLITLSNGESGKYSKKLIVK